MTERFAQEFADQTHLTPLALGVLAGAMLLVWLLRRGTSAALVLLIVSCTVSDAPRLSLGGLDFTVTRLLVVAAITRVLIRGEARGFAPRGIDWLVALYALASLVGYTVSRGAGGFVYRAGVTFDVLGLFLAFRLLVRDLDDVRAVARGLCWTVPFLAAAFAVEWLTRRNGFSVFGGVREVTWIRGGRLRCQGAFNNPILAGCFFAGVLPVAGAMAWSRLRDRGLGPTATGPAAGAAAVAACLTGVFFTASSTPAAMVLLIGAGFAGYPLWRQLRSFRWAAAAMVVALHAVMEKPVWHLLGRVDLSGSSTGYHRYRLMDAFVRNFAEWAPAGVVGTRHWGRGLDDLTNQYVIEGVAGGLASLVLFLAVLWAAFAGVGRMLRGLDADRRDPAALPVERRRAGADHLLAWSVGVALAAHCFAFIGIGYFGQIQVLWYFTLAATAAALPPPPAGGFAVESDDDRADGYSDGGAGGMTAANMTISISVVIPAHDEAAVIGRCLRALDRGLLAGDDARAVVVANGCSDRTADAAREAAGRLENLRVRVVETPAPGKANALNLGDDDLAAAGWAGGPRAYLDADVEVDGLSLRRVALALAEPGVLAAGPRARVELSGRPWSVRSFYAVWSTLPGVRAGMIGTGLFALSEAGRARFGRFPHVTADDTFVRLHFAEHERRSVGGATAVVHAPTTRRELVAIKTRAHFGNLELRDRRPDLWAGESVGAASGLRRLARDPRWWPALANYAAVRLAAPPRRRPPVGQRRPRPLGTRRRQPTRGSHAMNQTMNQATPKLSIVIIVWNDLAVLKDCLKSVSEQTGLPAQEVQVIVSDNGSTDGSVEWAREHYPQIEFALNGENLGYAKGNNRGITLARGELVLILNPDTVLHDRMLDGLVAFADANPQYGGYGCRVLNTDGTYQNPGPAVPVGEAAPGRRAVPLGPGRPAGAAGAAVRQRHVPAEVAGRDGARRRLAKRLLPARAAAGPGGVGRVRRTPFLPLRGSRPLPPHPRRARRAAVHARRRHHPPGRRLDEPGQDSVRDREAPQPAAVLLQTRGPRRGAAGAAVGAALVRGEAGGVPAQNPSSPSSAAAAAAAAAARTGRTCASG